MPCADAMIKDVITVTPDRTVSEVLEIFYNNRIRNVPVVDHDGVLQGIVSFRRLLAFLLPVSATMHDELKRFKHFNVNLDHLAGQAPWVTKRLRTLMNDKVEDIMFKEHVTVHPDTTLREGIRLLYLHESPLAVVEEGTGKLMGIMSSQSAIQALMKIRGEILEEKTA